VFKRTFFCCFLLLVGCSGRKDAEVRIALGSPGTQSIDMPAMLAQELGFYKEAGLNVTLIEFQGGSKALESMMGGSADVVCEFYDHTIQMAAEGKDFAGLRRDAEFPGYGPRVAQHRQHRGTAREDGRSDHARLLVAHDSQLPTGQAWNETGRCEHNIDR